MQNDITYYETPLFSKGYPMPFSKKSSYPNIKTIAEKFDQELAIMKKNGEYKKIEAKWLK